jgi:ERCC4-type nuclease
MITILIDDREKDVYPYFNELKNTFKDIQFEKRRLYTADYVITYKEKILAVIERKTWCDLSASFKDGRIKNIEKLKNTRLETNCHIVYVIEGDLCPKSTKKFSNIATKSLRAHLDHLLFRDNVHIIHTKNLYNTAFRIMEFSQNITTIKNYIKELDVIMSNSELKLDDSTSDSEKNNLYNGSDEKALVLTHQPPKEENIIYNMWCSFPGITTKTATLFIDAGFTISDFLLHKISKEQIAVLRYPSGSTISNRATKLLRVANKDPKNNKYYVKLLSCIPLISKNTAEKLLNSSEVNGRFTRLLKNKISPEQIATIQKTAKTKIGKKASENIKKYLSM